MGIRSHLCCCVQHIFDENAVTRGGVVDQHVGDGADEVTVLDDRRAGHADVKYGTKEFCVFLRFLFVFAGERQAFTYLTRDP